MCAYCEKGIEEADHNGNSIRVIPNCDELSVTIYDAEMYRCHASFYIAYCPYCGKCLV